MIRYRPITTQDAAYAQERELRNRVLRRPLGLELSEDDLRGEDGQAHIIAEDDSGQVVGCVLVAFAGKHARIRQIAVEGSYRGRGVGTGLLNRAEQAVRDRNVRTVTLHARVSARGFFERLGYTAVSGIFTEVTIPHVAMEKGLASSSMDTEGGGGRQPAEGKPAPGPRLQDPLP